MTAVPPRRRQQPLNLDGAWLVTESPEGTKDLPGMSVVADARGFTIAGPEPGSERTIPWELTTGFTCQRPARLPDGSPATMLEVGLANGRVLQLMLPVNRVPPSETVVVETELAVMSEQYGGRRPPVPGRDVTTLEKAAGEVAREGSTERLGRPRFETQERVATPAVVGAGVGAARGVNAGAAAGVRGNGSSANGSSTNGLSSLQTTGRSIAAEPSGSGVAVAPVEPAVAPTPRAAVPSSTSGPAPAQVDRPAPEPTVAPGSSPTMTQPEAPTMAQPETPSMAQPEMRPKAPAVTHSADANQDDGEDTTERREARENRLLYMLVALIGVVVVVLIAEVVLILFVLNHNTTSHNTSSIRETSALVYAPRDTR